MEPNLDTSHHNHFNFIFQMQHLSIIRFSANWLKKTMNIIITDIVFLCGYQKNRLAYKCFKDEIIADNSL